VRSLIDSATADAAELLEPTFRRTNGSDGRVAVEVDPALADRAQLTFEQARALWRTIDRPNLLVAIPATPEGIDAIAEAIASGISVDVTLLFSVEVYRLVIRSYLSGLERAQLGGHDIAAIHSVASFSVSPVDAEVDGRLGELETPDAGELRGTVAVANARLAYRVYQEEFARPRAQRLLARGAHAQRLLWADTGVADPDLPATFYVDELVAPETVIAMSRETLDAFADRGTLGGDAITGRYAGAVDTFRRLKAAGISYERVTDRLLADGVAAAQASRRELTATVAEALRRPL
jgi:transaldolase